MEYWNLQARRWSSEIFDTLGNDDRGTITEEIRRVAGSSCQVADFGCGVGNYLALLSALFGRVHGFEQSQACLTRARNRVKRLKNVELHLTAKPGFSFSGTFDVSVCVNAAIHPNRARWIRVLRSAVDLLKGGGWLVLVVPSSESADLIERVAASRDEFHIASGSSGIVMIEGVATKHFSYPELKTVLKALGARSSRIRRVRYSWASHGIKPAAKVQATPWDWLAMARIGSKTHLPSGASAFRTVNWPVTLDT